MYTIFVVVTNVYGIWRMVADHEGLLTFAKFTAVLEVSSIIENSKGGEVYAVPLKEGFRLEGRDVSEVRPQMWLDPEAHLFEEVGGQVRRVIESAI